MNDSLHYWQRGYENLRIHMCQNSKYLIFWKKDRPVFHVLYLQYDKKSSGMECLANCYQMPTFWNRNTFFAGLIFHSPLFTEYAHSA